MLARRPAAYDYLASRQLHHACDRKGRAAAARRVHGDHHVFRIVSREFVHDINWHRGPLAVEEVVHIGAGEGLVAAVGGDTHGLAQLVHTQVPVASAL